MGQLARWNSYHLCSASMFNYISGLRAAIWVVTKGWLRKAVRVGNGHEK